MHAQSHLSAQGQGFKCTTYDPCLQSLASYGAADAPITFPAGQLRVMMSQSGKAAPSTTQYTLFTSGGSRYKLKVSAGSHWRTGMHIKVAGRLTAASNTSPGGKTMPELVVSQVLRATSTSAATTAQDSIGASPASMAVLFVIITMCDQTASITPEVGVC
jgi:hypothetical protein